MSGHLVSAGRSAAATETRIHPETSGENGAAQNMLESTENRSALGGNRTHTAFRPTDFKSEEPVKIAQAGSSETHSPSNLSADGAARRCLHCGNPFIPKRHRPTEPQRNKYCSPQCGGQAPQKPQWLFTPKSTPEQRCRAHAVIQQLIRDGFVPPSRCENPACGRERRTDAHHPDYSRFLWVVWLCRSCHKKCHHVPGFEATVKPYAKEITSDAMEGRK